MADDLSSALRELADSAGRPAPTTGAEVRRRATSRRRRRQTALAGGTAVVAAAVVFGLSTALGGPDSHQRPAPPAVSPTAPSPTAPSPTAPTTVAGCAAEDLAFSVTKEDEEGKSARHLLLTVTNTGNKRCNVYNYPYLKFTYAREPIAVIKDSKDAPATLAPGEKAYAALLANGGRMDVYDTNTIPLSLQGPNPGSKVSDPINIDLPGQVEFDDGARVTYWTTASGLALRFITSS
ncbi:DUF4232 domain-containing protein [Streptomyces sp. NBC_01351]|uniref:DUF4232 domain-containing protein n=1 Tax=Streptomyces sp. NBC_01351 TaxID=2903833 RepID=UPI002E3152E2|nr:DUF4232 domain-containing protein [Streptomyces sp. NBC_01351]